jgi:hypothetical protein
MQKIGSLRSEDRCGVSLLKHQVEELIDGACLPSQRFTKDRDRTGSIGRAGGRWQQYIPACSVFFFFSYLEPRS